MPGLECVTSPFIHACEYPLSTPHEFLLTRRSTLRGIMKTRLNGHIKHNKNGKIVINIAKFYDNGGARVHHLVVVEEI